MSPSFGGGLAAKEHIKPRWVGWYVQEGREKTGDSRWVQIEARAPDLWVFSLLQPMACSLVLCKDSGEASCGLHGKMERSLGKSQTTWILMLAQLLARFVSLTMCPCLSFLKRSLRRMNEMFSFRLTKIRNYMIISHRMSSSWLPSGNVSYNVISQNYLSSQDALETNL